MKDKEWEMLSPESRHEINKRELQIRRVATRFIQEHEGMARFQQGFNPISRCECDTCKAAMEVLSMSDQGKEL